MTFGIDFELVVGDQERHLVHFHFNQVWGPLSISVDGKKVVGDFRWASTSTIKRYRFTTGDVERHDVVIEKTRPRLLAGFRKQTCRVFVDNVQVAPTDPELSQ